MNSSEQLLRRNVLEQEPARARAERFVDILLEPEGREDEDAGPFFPPVDELSGGFEPVQARHADVHENDVGPERPGGFDCLESVGRLADDFDLSIRLEDLAKACADERLVVCDENTNGHPFIAPRGRRTRTTKPPPLRAPASNSPS